MNWIWSNFKCALYVVILEVNFLNTNISFGGGRGCSEDFRRKGMVRC